MKKNTIKYTTIAVAISLVAAVGTYFVIMPKENSELNKLPKLKIEDSPTFVHLDKMPATDEIFGWVKELTSFGVRLPGSEAGLKASDYVADKFESFGLTDVGFIEGQTNRWIASEWDLNVSGTTIPSYFMTHSFNKGDLGKFSTPNGGLNAEIVYVGKGEESDFEGIDVKGKIVVAENWFLEVPIEKAVSSSYLFHDPDKTLSSTSKRLNPYSPNTYPENYYRAMSKGAVGFVGVLSNYIESNAYNNEDYSFIGGAMKIPGLWISKSAGDLIVSKIKDGKGRANASLKLSGEITKVAGRGVVGYLRGKSKEIIMVHSHHDSSTKGAVEDASGAAVVLALAKFYSQIPAEQREKTLLFTTMDTHFTGYEVHDEFIAKHLKGQEKILVDVCIEHIANEAEEVDGKLKLTGEVEPRLLFVSDVKNLIDISKEEIVRHNLKRTIILPTDMFGEDIPTDADPFHRVGVPVISLVSGPIYLYDNVDTLDKVAVNELRPVTETFADIIWRLICNSQ